MGILVAATYVVTCPCGKPYPNWDCSSCIRKRLCAEEQEKTRVAVNNPGH